MIPPGVDPDHAHGAPRKGDPGDRGWCAVKTCMHRVEWPATPGTPPKFCPLHTPEDQR